MQRVSHLALLTCAGLGLVLAAGIRSAESQPAPSGPQIVGSPLAVGKLLVAYGGCNDCHSPGWNESAGMLPVDKWLTGSSVGFRGPWGVSYPYNLRLFVASMTEDQWVRTLHTFAVHPPMPQQNLLVLSEANQRDIYRFIRSLGPAGTPAPAYVPPGTPANTPVIDFVPH